MKDKEMTAIEFLKAVKKACKSMTMCANCPFKMMCGGETSMSMELIKNDEFKRLIEQAKRVIKE